MNDRRKLYATRRYGVKEAQMCIRASEPRIDTINRGLGPSLNDEDMFTNPCLIPGEAFMEGRDAASLEGGLTPNDSEADGEEWVENPALRLLQKAYFAPENFGSHYLNKLAFITPRDNLGGVVPWADWLTTERPSCGGKK